MIPLNKSVSLLLCIGSMLCSVFAFALARQSDVLINWSSEEGIERLNRGDKVDFFKLANHFESQNNKIYCGVASSVIVLNALRVRSGNKQAKKPTADSVLSKEDRQYLPAIFSPYFERYTQDNIFTPQAKSKLEILGKPLKQASGSEAKRDIGLQLEQLKQLLEAHDLNVVKRVANEHNTLALFRQEVKANLASANDYVLVNYNRETLKQAGGGHISPLGAYDAQTDSVLVMDVNNNKADWVWVSLDLLYASMATFDTVENRGYLLISEK